MASQTAEQYHDLEVTFIAPKSSTTSKATIHYIEAGNSSNPKVLLLHGFPCSSHQYRGLIPLLSDNYHVLAPDYPGFGLSKGSEGFKYDFDNITAAVAAWLKALSISEAAVYIQDFGAPVGLRLAITGGLKLTAILSQNGNAYSEGLGKDVFAPLKSWWESGSEEIGKMISEHMLTLDGCKEHIVMGTPDQDMCLIDPQTWELAYLQNVAGLANNKRMKGFLWDYRTNIELYPEFQKYIRENKTPVLAAWGKNDPAFVFPGARAFSQDQPATEVHLLDAGHMALESKRFEIAKLINDFLPKALK